MIEKGIQFDIEETIIQRPSGFWGLLKKRIRKKIKHTFQIQEPTLRTLDLISSEAIEIEIDESTLASEAALTETKKLAHTHALRCARIIALAVLGRDYIIVKSHQNGYLSTQYDDKKLSSLTNLFFRTIKPSELLRLCILITKMMNLGDFINSIRLISGTRTAMPDRVEQVD